MQHRSWRLSCKCYLYKYHWFPYMRMLPRIWWKWNLLHRSEIVLFDYHLFLFLIVSFLLQYLLPLSLQIGMSAIQLPTVVMWMLVVSTSMAVISANVIKDLPEMERIAMVFTYIYYLSPFFSVLLNLYCMLLYHHENCISGIHIDIATLACLITICSMIAYQYFICGLIQLSVTTYNSMDPKSKMFVLSSWLEQTKIFPLQHSTFLATNN